MTTETQQKTFVISHENLKQFCDSWAAKCLRKGPVTPTNMEYVAERLRQHVAEFDETPATVKPDWEIPTCKHPGYTLTASLSDGDGWHLYWYDEEHDRLIELSDHAWPFVENYARGSDFEKLGFQIQS